MAKIAFISPGTELSEQTKSTDLEKDRTRVFD